VWSGRCRQVVVPRAKVRYLLGPESRVRWIIVSELQVVGRTQSDGDTHRFGNSLLPYSLEGDPAPARPEPSWAPAWPRPLPRGYLKPEPAGSMGEFVAEPLADLEPPMLSWGSPSRLSL
jgi:hypothetical protein